MFENKKILILGFARSGYQAAKVLRERGNVVYLNDFKVEDLQDKEQVAELRGMGVNLVFGSHPDDLLDETFDYLIKNPGVPIDHKYVLTAKKLGIPVINEVEMAYKLLPSGVDIIGITGTNGKTTTTTITYEIMHKAFGDKVHLAGNIGYPLSSILNSVKSGDIIVMECSCQQGENFVDFHPHVGVMTNLSEAHIDFMKTYEHYKNTKSKMFYNQSDNDIAILNHDNDDVLNEMVNICKNSNMLGEVALVPYDSPISNMNEVFLETLFDENAACHIALGDSFPECVENGPKIDKDVLFNEYHLNKCDSHVDFMVGNEDMSIIGITEDGKEVPIFVDGNFSEIFE